MTLPATTRRAGPFTGNGVTTAFPFTFKVFAESDIAVVLTDEDGVETALTLDADYSVALNADQETSPGGTITYPLAGDELTADELLTAIGDLDYEQPTDLPSGGNFRAGTIEDALDRNVMLIQQQREIVSRALKFPLSDGTPADELPAAAGRMDRLLGFDETTGAPEVTNLTQTQLAYAVGAAYAAASTTPAAVSVTPSGGDDTAALQAALDACAVSGRTLQLDPDGVYVITAGLTYNHQAHTIRGEGATIYAPTVVGYALTIRGGLETDTATIYQSPLQNIQGLRLRGARAAGQHGVLLGHEGGTTISGANFCASNLAILSFDRGLSFGSNAYLARFEKVQIYDCITTHYYPAGLTNSGENISFHQCAAFNSTNGVDAVGGAFLNFVNSSFDYITNYSIHSQGGAQITCDACHFEGNSDADYWVKTSAATSSVRLNDCSYVLAANRTVELFSGGASDGGIRVNGGFFTRTNVAFTYSPQFLGTGYVWQDGRVMGQSPTDAFRSKPMSAANGYLADPGFAGTLDNILRVDLFARESQAGISKDGNTLKIAPATGTQSRLRKLVMCGPGSTPMLSYKIKNSIGNATDSLTITINTYDQSGNQTQSARSVTYNQASQNADFTEATLMPFLPAPAGTAFLRVAIGTNASAVDGTTSHWLDDFHLTIRQGEVPSISYDSTAETTGFTPTVVGSTSAGAGTYTEQFGRYTIVGNLCFFTLSLVWTATTGTGNLRIGGLPFKQAYANLDVYQMRGSGFAFTGPVVAALAVSDSNQISITEVSAAGVAAAIAIPAAGTLHISGFYRISGV